jgi:hypothetical protein
MISIRSKGDYRRTEKYLNDMSKNDMFRNLSEYAQEGVAALAAATPVDSGMTAASWSYEIVDNGDSVSIHWINTNVNKNANIAIILQYGHGTGTGGYVQGRDYINPAMRPVFDHIEESVIKEMRGR